MHVDVQPGDHCSQRPLQAASPTVQKPVPYTMLISRTQKVGWQGCVSLCVLLLLPKLVQATISCHVRTSYACRGQNRYGARLAIWFFDRLWESRCSNTGQRLRVPGTLALLSNSEYYCSLTTTDESARRSEASLSTDDSAARPAVCSEHCTAFHIVGCVVPISLADAAA